VYVYIIAMIQGPSMYTKAAIALEGIYNYTKHGNMYTAQSTTILSALLVLTSFL